MKKWMPKALEHYEQSQKAYNYKLPAIGGG
jgi:hypothetical protein